MAINFPHKINLVIFVPDWTEAGPNKKLAVLGVGSAHPEIARSPGGSLELPSAVVEHHTVSADITAANLARKLCNMRRRELVCLSGPSRSSREITSTWLVISAPIQSTEVISNSGHFRTSASDSDFNADDHVAIKHARQRLAELFELAPVVFDMLPKMFTIPDLRRIIESVVGREFDGGNFSAYMTRMKILARVPKAKRPEYEGRGRPPIFYTYVRSKFRDSSRRWWRFEEA